MYSIILNGKTVVSYIETELMPPDYEGEYINIETLPSGFKENFNKGRYTYENGDFIFHKYIPIKTPEEVMKDDIASLELTVSALTAENQMMSNDHAALLLQLASKGAL